MPEAPEVHELALFLTEHAAGRTISAIDVVFGKAVKTQHPPVSDLIGSRITGVGRHAKMIDVAVVAADGAPRHAIVHFGHDGWVLWHDSVPDGVTRAGEATLMARVRLDDGSGFDLTDAGQWKSLAIHVVTDAAAVPAIAKLGLDPMADDFELGDLERITAGRKKQLKGLLQDQAALAGIGNAYSDEILHDARLSPLVHAALLAPDEVARLYRSMRTTLMDATAARRGIRPDALKSAKHAAMRVHGRAGEPCGVCANEIREITFSGAAAQYCPTCQTGGALLAGTMGT